MTEQQSSGDATQSYGRTVMAAFIVLAIWCSLLLALFALGRAA